MNASVCTQYESLEVLDFQEVEKPAARDNEIAEAFTELRARSAGSAGDLFQRPPGQRAQLAGVHAFIRAGQGHCPGIPGAERRPKYTVIFCTPRRAELLKARLKPKSYQVVSSQDIGLPLGVRALAVERKALPGGVPFQTGGGTARLVSPGWVIWAKAPDKFEAGTPAIVNVIAFAKALRLIQHFGKDAFQKCDRRKTDGH